MDASKLYLRSIPLAAALALAVLAPQNVQLRADPVDGQSAHTVVCSLHSSAEFHRCIDLPSAKNCIEEMNFASFPSKDRTGMSFVNRSDAPIKIYWLDFRAMRTLYRFLPPGDKFTQPTFVGHNWLVSTVADQCIGIFKAGFDSVAFF